MPGKVPKMTAEERVAYRERFKKHNGCVLASKGRRAGKYVNRKPCRVLQEHAEALADDNERLSSSFLLSIIYSTNKTK